MMLRVEHYERQSARMSEIKNACSTWMALSTLKCNHLTLLHFKGLTKATEYSSWQCCQLLSICSLKVGVVHLNNYCVLVFFVIFLFCNHLL